MGKYMYELYSNNSAINQSSFFSYQCDKDTAVRRSQNNTMNMRYCKLTAITKFNQNPKNINNNFYLK